MKNKPLVATASKCKTIKIELCRKNCLDSKIWSLSCFMPHSGLHLAVACPDKLRILNIQRWWINEQFKRHKSIQKLPICKILKGRSIFCTASGNIVHVFKFYTGLNSGKIRSMAWSKLDNILVTCGADGIIIAYRVGKENCAIKFTYSHSTK